jgi:hypothetical protein
LTEIPTEYGGSTRTLLIVDSLDNKITLSWLGKSNGYYSEQVNYKIYTLLSTNKEVHTILSKCLAHIDCTNLEVKYKRFPHKQELIDYYLTFEIEDLIRNLNNYIAQSSLTQLGIGP